MQRDTTNYRPLFYPLAGVWLTLWVVAGFWPQYYRPLLTGAELAPRVSNWGIHLHSAIFLAWVAGFALQGLLVRQGRVDLHRRIGVRLAVFGFATAVVGAFAGFAVILHHIRDGMAMDRGATLVFFIFNDLGMFVGFLAAAIYYRRRREIHNRGAIPVARLVNLRLVMNLMPFAVAALMVSAASAAPAIEEAVPNDNRERAGRLTGHTLRVELEAREAMWYPEAHDGPGYAVQAFAERGAGLTVPGPQIRVREGTRIHATIRNRLSVKLTLHGFHSHPGESSETVEFAPGQVIEFNFDAGVAGTYYYWGSTMAGSSFNGRPVYLDAVLSGAFIVDSRGYKPNPRERVFMLGAIRKDIALDDPKLPKRGAGQVRSYTINGLAWPYSERLTYSLGDKVDWRWINASYEPHPLHLHGFYFDVLSVGNGERDSHYAIPERPHVFTNRVEAGGTMTMAWISDRVGNWLFHCHMLDHIGPHLRLRPAAPQISGHDHSSMDHVRDGMSGLVLGVTVKPGRKRRVPTETVTRRRINLFVQDEPNRFGSTAALGYALQVGDLAPPTDTVEIPGPLLVLTRGEPTSVAIINRSKSETSVHWHGMELESYFDGVPGWGGDDRRVTPPIKPGETFIAEMTPPRAGTFMYHTHWHDDVQLTSGMYGPLIVTEPEKPYDPATERMVVLSARPHAPDIIDPLLINGRTSPAPLQMQAGTRYRIRMINITPSAVNYSVRLVSGGQPIEWRCIAKDGIELPVTQAVITRETLSLAVGETRDFEFRPETPGELKIEVHIPERLRASIGIQVQKS